MKSAGPDRCLSMVDPFLRIDPEKLPSCLLSLPRSFGRRQCAFHASGRELISASYATSTRRRLRVSDGIANSGLLSARSRLPSEDDVSGLFNC